MKEHQISKTYATNKWYSLDFRGPEIPSFKDSLTTPRDKMNCHVLLIFFLFPNIVSSIHSTADCPVIQHQWAKYFCPVGSASGTNTWNLAWLPNLLQ